ncbi:MAG: YaiO family outer membrane beta-barrel protein [Acidobacteria bacterium]|nr:YaiO family outer membrane beta-barrel protein [Acidobacteriota bacterium]
MTRLLRHALVALFLCWCAFVVPAGSALAQTPDVSPDALAQARALSSDGKRGEALSLLRAHLTKNPDDSDARVVYGTMLSWDGQYDAARQQLEAVLKGHPGHGDALPALINVELWSDRPQRAEALAAEALHEKPNDTTYLLSHARALQAMARGREALDEVRRVLNQEPSNEQALRLRRTIQSTLQFWQVGVGFSFDRFDDDRQPWQEGDLSLKRQTRVGAIIGRASRARRFGVDDQQFEVEMYPRFRPGSYAYISVAVAPDAAFFPDYRFGFDFWQSLGAGFEGSGGFRRLHFGDDVDIYTVTLGKYYGNWYAGARSYILPHDSGNSVSVHGWVRRFFRDADTYAGVRYGRGASREEIRDQNDLALLQSETFAAEVNLPATDRLIVGVRGSVSRDQRADRDPLRQHSFSTSLYYRF